MDKASQKTAKTIETSAALPGREESPGFPLIRWDFAVDGTVLVPRFKTVLGYKNQQIEAMLKDSLDCFHPDDRKNLKALWHACLMDTAPCTIKCRIKKESGEYAWVLAKGHAVRDQQGKVMSITGSVTEDRSLDNPKSDLNERDGELQTVAAYAGIGIEPETGQVVVPDSQWIDNEEDLRMAASVFSNTQDGILILSPDRTIIKANHAFEEILGYSQQEISGRGRTILKSGSHDPKFYAEIWQTVDQSGSWQGEVLERHKNGRIIPIWYSLDCLYNEKGEVTRYIAILYDLTDQKKSQDQINYLAHYDILTGLPNRAMLKERLAHALRLAERQKTMLAVLFIDLDNFKHINDTYGHPVGDELLCEVAKRLQATVRKSDTLARLGGDEFMLLAENIKNVYAVKTAAEKIIGILAEPVVLGEVELFLSASIGISLYPNDGTDIDTLVRNADMALYRSKDSGRNQFHFYKEEMSNLVQERMALQTELRQYLEKEGLELHYQPVVNSATRECIGAEALIRWQHQEKGYVPPEKFIPIAEENDLIHTLGEWVLFTACRQMKEWIDSGLHLKFISVNVSGKQIVQGDFVKAAKRILGVTGCPAQRITLELTESFIMEDSRGAIAQLNELRAMGFGLAIDDFGTGYSSLAYLKHLPVTKLKLDRSFLQNLSTGCNDAAIARAILKLGETLGLEVIAEGVENEDQHQFLESEHSTMCQGFLYAKPMATNEFSKFVQGLGQGRS